MLSDEVIAELNEKLNLIAETIGTQQRVRITYFVPDNKKAGGGYITCSGCVKKFDEYEHTVIMEDKTVIPIKQISDIDVTTLAYDMTSFRVQTEVSASPTFFGWVFGFNGKVQILAPESVKEQYRQMIAKADEDMQESE